MIRLHHPPVFGPMARATGSGSAVLKPFVKQTSRALKSKVTLSAVIICAPVCISGLTIPAPGSCNSTPTHIAK